MNPILLIFTLIAGGIGEIVPNMKPEISAKLLDLWSNINKSNVPAKMNASVVSDSKTINFFFISDLQSKSKVLYENCHSSQECSTQYSECLNGKCKCQKDYVDRDGVCHELENGKAYKLHTTLATYEEAKRICNKEGGKLAVVNSAADEKKLLDLWKPVGIIPNAAPLDRQAYIGMDSLTEVGVWKTIDNTPVKYVNWSQDWLDGRQPSHPDRQKCGSLLMIGGMDDIDCWVKIAFFCEKTYKLHTTPANYEEAKSICNKEGGKLAVLNSAADEQKLLDLWKPVGIIPNAAPLDRQAYIGMDSLTEVGVWKTIDNTPVKYVNWSQDWSGERQPSHPDRQKCGSLLMIGGMDDVDCWVKLAFFCENP